MKAEGKVHALSSTQYSVKVSDELERTSGVDIMILYSHDRCQEEDHRINVSQIMQI